MEKPASLSAAIFLIMVAGIQVIRILFGIDVIVAGMQIPYWVNAAAACLLMSLAGWLLKERGRK
jgi:hypothetical protein